jgi:type I restriction enzyme M protein
MEEMDEEHGGEEGLLAEAKNEKGKLTKASKPGLTAHQSTIRTLPTSARLLNAYANLIEQEADRQAKMKDAQKALDRQGRRANTPS